MNLEDSAGASLLASRRLRRWPHALAAFGREHRAPLRRLPAARSWERWDRAPRGPRGPLARRRPETAARTAGGAGERCGAVGEPRPPSPAGRGGRRLADADSARRLTPCPAPWPRSRGEEDASLELVAAAHPLPAAHPRGPARCELKPQVRRVGAAGGLPAPRG